MIWCDLNWCIICFPLLSAINRSSLKNTSSVVGSRYALPSVPPPLATLLSTKVFQCICFSSNPKTKPKKKKKSRQLKRSSGGCGRRERERGSERGRGRKKKHMRKTVALLFFFFPMARLPGVVRQNMADFHSNPLGWDTVQLSLVCLPQKRKKKPHSITQHLFLLLLLSRSSRRRRRRSSRRVSPRCSVKRRPRLRSSEGRRS